MDQIKTKKLTRVINSSKGGDRLVTCVKNFILPLVALAIMLFGCATSPAVQKESVVMPGDQANVRFTCLLKNGEVAISTYQEVNDDPKFPRSMIFLPRDRSTPLALTAGISPKNMQNPGEAGFEGEIMSQLSKIIVGLPTGGKQAFQLKAENRPERQRGEYLIRIAKVRQRPKEMRFTPEEYEAKTGNKPQVGRFFRLDPALPGKIESVSNTEVIVRFSPEQGKEVTTPFGKGTVRELADRYEIVIDAQPGSLVRSGGFVGRIMNVDYREITIDYGNPFGGELLLCDVLIESTKPAKQETVSAQFPIAPLQDKTAPGEALLTADEVNKGKQQAQVTVLKPEKFENKTVTAKGTKVDREDAKDLKVKEGDLATVNYTASLEDGSLIYSTLPDVARDPDRKKVIGYAEPQTFAPEEMVAGKPARVPGVGQSIIGMAPGEKQKLTIPAASAYGPPDPTKVRTYPFVRNFPRTLPMTPSKFVEQFQIFPVQGSEVQLSPFLKARVKGVTPISALLELTVKDGERFEVDYGVIDIRSNEEQVIVTMTPRIGATFNSGEAEGRIVSADGKDFTVDFNPPVAGKAVVLDMEVVSLIEASSLASTQVTWVEDYDAGLAEAKKEDKPAVLLLYADWCSWCKKFQNETVQDARIKAMQSGFVWIRVNSDKQKDFQTKYQQNGFPLILILASDGKVSRRIEGYVDAASFRETLGASIENKLSRRG